MTTSISNPVLNAILYDKNIKYAFYACLYFILFLSVGIISAIKTYRAESVKLARRRDAFRSRAYQCTSPAPIQLTDTDIETIKQRKMMKKHRSTNGSTSHNASTATGKIPLRIGENAAIQHNLSVAITVDQYIPGHHNNTTTSPHSSADTNGAGADEHHILSPTMTNTPTAAKSPTHIPTPTSRKHVMAVPTLPTMDRVRDSSLTAQDEDASLNSRTRISTTEPSHPLCTRMAVHT